jgi:drug/metabolite transporter (DMT)-like permease
VTTPKRLPAVVARQGWGIAAVIASALSFGAMAIFARRAYAAGVDTTTLLALRFGIAASRCRADACWAASSYWARWATAARRSPSSPR